MHTIVLVGCPACPQQQQQQSQQQPPQWRALATAAAQSGKLFSIYDQRVLQCPCEVLLTKGKTCLQGYSHATPLSQHARDDSS